MDRAGNASYSKEFKASCVLAVLRGEGSVDDIVAKYNISSRSVLWHWMKQYNDHIELKDYDPKREVYMAGARKKTSLSKRKEIVEYCLSHGKNYKDTAAYYDVSYSQVYDWVRKHVADGETGLIDRRGHHKTDEEVDEMERLNIADALNQRPCCALGYHTPSELFDAFLDEVYAIECVS